MSLKSQNIQEPWATKGIKCSNGKKEQMRKEVEEIMKIFFFKLMLNITAYFANSENTKQNEG